MKLPASCSRENNSVPGGMPSRPPRKISNLCVCFDFIFESESCGKFALFARIISIWFIRSTIFLPSLPILSSRNNTETKVFHETRYSWRKIFPRKRYIYTYIYTFGFWTIAFQFTMVERIDAVDSETSRRSWHKERVDAREKKREAEKKKRRKRGRDNSVYNEGGIQIPAVPPAERTINGKRKRKRERKNGYRRGERRREERVERAQRGRQGNISQSSKSWGHHEWVLEERGRRKWNITLCARREVGVSVRTGFAACIQLT